jgi:excisionase family DNA binding protein
MEDMGMFIDEVYTPEEVAKHLRVPIDAVLQEIKSGKLRAIVVAGEHFRVRVGDLGTYKNEAYTRAVPSPNHASQSAETPMNLRAAPDFEHKWPDGKIEHFENVFDGVASFWGKEYSVKVGFTVRKSSGQHRSRTLVLVDRYPTVEFVAASEKVKPTDLMASILRDRNGKQLPVGATLPPEYAGMNVRPYREIVVGPGAANGLAVICEASDKEAMVKHALIRYRFREERT